MEVEIKLDPASHSHDAGLAWGQMRVWLAGNCVWCQQCREMQSTDAGADEPAAVRWTWVDLLQGLARIWPWLRLEEGYPLPLSPEHPGQLMGAAEERWRDLAQGQVEVEEDALYDFRQRHDLSLLLRGISLPPLWWVKEGREAVFWSPDCSGPVRMSHREALSLWSEVAGFLCDALAESETPRAKEAVRRWQTRKEVGAAQCLPVISGMDWPELAELAGTNAHADIANFLEYAVPAQGDQEDDLLLGNELLMAARMTTGYVGVQHQRKILLAIKALPRCATPTLDELSKLAPTPLEGQPAWQQGYDLAHWLRPGLGLVPGDLVEPEHYLKDWGVELRDIDLPAPLDALAVWGLAHGPAILCNTHALSRSSTRNGRRTALAHEICHLLLDREGALPVAEVLRGGSPRWAEKRANAFAAEFLLPREEVALRVSASNDLLSTLELIEQQFQVSRELICHQLFNSTIGLELSRTERLQLESWKRV
ncbi:ImmA/IrrE family metallo-endopeptidase [Ectothiorhodospira shaposhnikovii]|uniref:ImmA/IrrE family metallo-endopeptidase n=1 Tax=Ectothiorhodospira shaposhnikovii TaxID=1054 RepID=UPI0039A3E2DB